MKSPGGGGNPAYTTALAVLDSDMAQYVHDNTDDEFTHQNFLNAYLASKRAATVDLEPFRLYRAVLQPDRPCPRGRYRAKPDRRHRRRTTADCHQRRSRADVFGL